MLKRQSTVLSSSWQVHVCAFLTLNRSFYSRTRHPQSNTTSVRADSLWMDYWLPSTPYTRIVRQIYQWSTRTGYPRIAVSNALYIIYATYQVLNNQVVVVCCSHINSLTKESVVTQRCWRPRKIRKTKKNRKFGCLKIHETKKAHTR